MSSVHAGLFSHQASQGSPSSLNATCGLLNSVPFSAFFFSLVVVQSHEAEMGELETLDSDGGHEDIEAHVFMLLGS